MTPVYHTVPPGSLELFVAGQQLNASHPRSPVWPNQTVTLFSENHKKKVIIPQPIEIFT